MKKKLLIGGAVSMIVGMSAAHATVTTYDVTETFNQVVYDTSHPDWDTIFKGSFTYDSDTHTVSNLTGLLSQAMDGNTTWVPLNYQLSTVANGTDGLIVSVFKNNSTATFVPSTTYPYSGGDFGGNGVNPSLVKNLMKLLPQLELELILVASETTNRSENFRQLAREAGVLGQFEENFSGRKTERIEMLDF